MSEIVLILKYLAGFDFYIDRANFKYKKYVRSLFTL